MWYVIQTQSGREEIIQQMITRTIPKDYYENIRIIYYEVKRKYQGVWHVEQRRMFPGYLFLITDAIGEIRMRLKKIPEMTKLLGMDDMVLPISKEEELFLQRLTGDDDMVELSVGIQEGNRVIVKEGSLKGFESSIRKIDRHKRRAWIEVQLLGESRLVEVGLEIVEKK